MWALSMELGHDVTLNDVQKLVASPSFFLGGGTIYLPLSQNKLNIILCGWGVLLLCLYHLSPNGNGIGQ